MPKTKKTSAFDDVMAGLEDALAHAQGEGGRAVVHHFQVPASVDVKALRKRLDLTQDAFAMRYGFSKGAVRDWEQGRKAPEATARVLLTVIEREAEAVDRALRPDHADASASA